MLYQNDAFGEDLKGGFEDAIEGSDIKIVAEESYEVTDPTVAPQVAKLAGSGADTFLNITTPKPGAQAIGAVAKSDWRPLHILNNVASSKTLVLKPVGFEAAQGIVSTTYFKDPEEPEWADDAAMKEYKAQLKKFAPKPDPNEPFNVYGWAAAADDGQGAQRPAEPDREELMDVGPQPGHGDRAAAAGHQVKTGEDDGYPIQSMQIMRFKDENWKLEDEVIQAPH